MDNPTMGTAKKAAVILLGALLAMLMCIPAMALVSDMEDNAYRSYSYRFMTFDPETGVDVEMAEYIQGKNLYPDLQGELLELFLADPEEHSGFVGDEITINAPEIPGFETPFSTFTLQDDPSMNDFIIYYSPRMDLMVTIDHIDTEGNVLYAPYGTPGLDAMPLVFENPDQIFGTTSYAFPETTPGYSLLTNPVSESGGAFVVGLDADGNFTEETHISFVYEYAPVPTTYTVTYYCNGTVLDSETLDGLSGDRLTVYPKQIEGYVADSHEAENGSSLCLFEDPTINQLGFNYTSETGGGPGDNQQEVSYSVNYYCQGAEEMPFYWEYLTGYVGQEITISPSIDTPEGFIPEAESKTIVLSDDPTENNMDYLFVPENEDPVPATFTVDYYSHQEMNDSEFIGVGTLISRETYPDHFVGETVQVPIKKRIDGYVFDFVGGNTLELSNAYSETVPVYLNHPTDVVVTVGCVPDNGSGDDDSISNPATLSLVTTNAAARMSTNCSVEDGVDYTAIKVFSADIEGSYNDAEAPKASNIQFAEGVTGEIIAGDAEDDLSNPQAAAEFIAANIDHQPGVGLAADDYGMALAKRLVLAGAETQEVTADGGAVVLDGSGYYLIVRTDALEGESTAATSPIFAAVGSGETEIVLKVAIPTITKEVQEDSDGSWGDAADHSVNQVVPYHIIGTVAQNVASYETYAYTFHDEWDISRMSIFGNIRVVVRDYDGTEQDITDFASIDTSEGLTVSFENLFAAYPALNEATSIVLEYSMIQTGTSAPEGIENTAWLEYSNNPMVEGSMGSTKRVQTTDYSYLLVFHKTDNATGDDLAGALFTVQNSDGQYLALNEAGAVVEQDEPYEWESQEDGLFVIDGVDVDAYTVTETQAPNSSYRELDAPFVVTIDGMVDVEGEDGETSQVFDRTTLHPELDKDYKLIDLETPTADYPTAAAVVNVKNIKHINLPSTGEAGIGLLIIFAVSGAVCYLMRRRRPEAESDVVMHV